MSELPKPDVEPLVPFDAVHDERVRIRPFDVGVFVVLVLLIAMGQGRWLSIPIGTCVLAFAYAWRARRVADVRERLSAVEMFAAAIGFTVTACIGYRLAIEIDYVARTFARPALTVRLAGLSLGAIALGAAVAFAGRRWACVANRGGDRIVDVELVAGLWATESERGLDARRVAIAASIALVVGAAAFAVPLPAQVQFGLVFPVAMGVGWWCGPRSVLFLGAGAVVAATVAGDPAPVALRAPWCAVVAFLGAGVAVWFESVRSARAADVRLGGGERFRLEIGGLGTRAEPMVPRTEQQFSFAACVMWVLVGIGLIVFAAPHAMWNVAAGASAVTAAIVVVCLVVAAAATAASTRVSSQLVGAFGLFVVTPAGVPLARLWGGVEPALALCGGCAIVGASAATYVLQVGARAGATPLRTQRAWIFGACVGLLVIVGLGLTFASADREALGPAIGNEAVAAEWTRVRAQLDADVSVPTTVAALVGFGLEVGVGGGAGLATALGFLLGPVGAVLLGLAAFVAARMRRRGLSLEHDRSIGAGLTLGGLFVFVVQFVWLRW
jgi:hypothetical protein